MRLGWLKESYSEILKKYLVLDRQKCQARKKFDQTPLSQRANLFENFKNWVPLYIAANMYMIDAIERFSPQTAKILKGQIMSLSKRQKELLGGKYWSAPEFEKFSEKQLNEHVKRILNIAIRTGDIHEKEINLIFVAATDTLKNVRGEFPLKPEERILRALIKANPRLGEIYSGAYSALDSENPERFRHCSVSMRQIIDGVVGKTSEERRNRIEHATESKQEADILKSLDKLITSVELAWNKGVHAEIQAETAFLAVEATELMISYLYHLNHLKTKR